MGPRAKPGGLIAKQASSGKQQAQIAQAGFHFFLISSGAGMLLSLVQGPLKSLLANQDMLNESGKKAHHLVPVRLPETRDAIITDQHV